MTYEILKPWRVYPGQTKIPLPKTGTGEGAKPGFRNAIFLVTPKRENSRLFFQMPNIAFQTSMYRNVTADGYYRTKIGTKTVRVTDVAGTKRYYKEMLEPNHLHFIGEQTRATFTKTKKNIIVDLSRWMELWFQYNVVRTPKQVVSRFLTLLAARLEDPSYNGYTKTILINLDDWGTEANKLILMNSRVLTNPLSIILYAAFKFPDQLFSFHDCMLYLISANGGQALKVPMAEIDKDHLKTLKTRLKQFKNIVVSADDEDEVVPSSYEDSVAEMKAEEREAFKEKLTNALKGSLTGKPPKQDNSEETPPTDTTEDEEKQAEIEADLSEEGSESEDELDDMEADAIAQAIDDYLNGDGDPTDEEEAKRIIANNAKKKYIAKFVPDRTPEQQARIDRLTKGQKSVIKQQDPKDMKTKLIEKTDLSGYVQTTNPTIKESKFMNFDKGYVEKKMATDIDSAVAVLSKATHPIFIVSKEEVDTSDAMNLKKTMIYHMEDSKGNRSTIKFDVPIIIDNSYVFLNGSKKLIGHQFVIKPIAKTGPDTVQLVSWYQKIFLMRTGQIDENTNSIRIYLQKNPEQFKTQIGNNSMKNGNYDTPLDYDVLARTYSMYTINEYEFYTYIDGLKEKFLKKYGNKTPVNSANNAEAIPVAIDTKRKELLYYYPATGSYTDFLLSLFTPAQKKEIMKIKRKPRLFGMTAKMLNVRIPAILFMLHAEGFTKVMQKAGIEYKFIQKNDMKDMDPLKWSFIQLEDCILAWSKAEQSNTLLMNPLMKFPLEMYTKEELDSKDTYFNLLTDYYPGNSDISGIMDNYFEFFIDAATEEILTDMGMPTNLVELMIVGARMLSDSKYKSENDLNNMRIRSAEVIPNLIYTEITHAYNKYRRTASKAKPTQISIKPNAIIDAFLDGKKTNLVSDASSLNPVLELEKSRAVTFRGLRGIQLDRAMTQPRRGYHESMLGVLGISTPSEVHMAPDVKSL